MERDESGVGERTMGTARNPLLAMALVSIRILLYSLRHGGKPLRVNYRTGSVRVDRESANR